MNQEFEKKAREIAGEIKMRDDFLVVGNFDADGLSSSAIIGIALKRLGKKFKVRVLKQLYLEEIKRLKKKKQTMIFTDFGSGQLKELKENLPRDFFVIDHHQPVKVDHPMHLNPLLFGVDGGAEISAAGTAYLVARELGDNKDLAALAIVGAVGDVQLSDGKLAGHNREIMQEGIGAGVVSKKEDLALYGRISRPLTQFLQFCTTPVLPGLTGNEDACMRFLLQNKIELKDEEKWRSYESLLSKEKQSLCTALILRLKEQNFADWKIQELFGEVYTLEKESGQSPLRDAKEYSTVLNACGRYKQHKVALSVLFGNRKKYYRLALGLLAEHRKKLRDAITFMVEKGLDEHKNFYFFDAEGKIQDSIIGIVAGMLYGSGTIPPNKPIIAITQTPDGSLKASGRATKELVTRGLNLGHAFKELQKKWGEGTEGGGHSIAAGVKFPKEKKQEFLDEMEKIIGRQIGEN